MAKRAVRVLVLTGLLGGLIGGSAWFWMSRQGHEHTDNAYIHGDLTVISPKISGHVVELAVEDNQPVRAGQVLLRIDARDFQVKVEEAEATLQGAEAAVAVTDKRVAAQKTAVEEAEAGLRTWQAELDLAQREQGRTASLVREEAASRQRLDTTQATLSKARAGLDQARAKVEAARAQIAVLEADRPRQQAAIAEARAKLEAAKINLANTEVTSPVDGVVGNRAVQLGQFVATGSHLLSVVPLETVWVEANFKETQIGAMRPGQPVTVTVDAYPDLPLHGTVASFSPASGAQFSLLPPENATGNFTKVVQRIPVRITLPADNPLRGQLRPGLSVVVDVRTGAGSGGSAQASDR